MLLLTLICLNNAFNYINSLLTSFKVIYLVSHKLNVIVFCNVLYHKIGLLLNKNK